MMSQQPRSYTKSVRIQAEIPVNSYKLSENYSDNINVQKLSKDLKYIIKVNSWRSNRSSTIREIFNSVIYLH